MPPSPSGTARPGLGAEEGLILDAELVRPGDDDVSRRVRVAVADDDVPDDVGPWVVAVAVSHRRPVGVERVLLEGALHVDDRLERLVLDHDRLERTPRLLRVLGRDDDDRLADVAHAVDREHRLVGELEPVELLPRDVRVRQHGVDAVEAQGGAQVDRDDPRMRVRAAQRVAPQHARRGEVARVGELARDLRHGVVSEHPLADPADGEPALGGDAHRSRRRQPAPPLTGASVEPTAHARSAAIRTASKTFV